MPSARRQKAVTLAAALAAAALISGCSGDDGAGKRLKDGFLASQSTKTGSFKMTMTMKLPSFEGEQSDFSLSVDGDYDNGDDAKAIHDDISRFTFETSEDGKKTRGEMIQVGDMEYTVSGDETIGGPSADGRFSDRHWADFLDALAAHTEDFESSGSKLVNGVKLDRFAGTLPKDAACGRLADQLEALSKELDPESGEDTDINAFCNTLVDGEVAMQIGIDQKAWPRQISADAVISSAFLLEGLGDEEIPDAARELIESQSGKISIDIEVTQYNQPIKPIKAPRDAKIYKTRAEYVKASDRLSG